MAPPPARISIIIVDSEDLARALLTASLASFENIEIVGAFADAETAIEAARRLHPKVVVIELELRGALDGIQAGLALRREFPDAGIVWLSAYKRPYIPMSFQLTTGWAYLLKTSGTDVRSLAAAIDGVANGLVVLDPEIAAIMNRLRSEWLPRLSLLEHDVLALMAHGLSDAGIAQALDVPQQSVKRHIDQIYRRLGLGLGGRADVKHRRVETVLAYLRGGAGVPESETRTIGTINEPQRRSQQAENTPSHTLLDQWAFVERMQEEIARCLRTRRHLSVALLAAGAAAAVTGQRLALGPDALRSIAEDLARHIRRYDLVAVSGAAEVMLMFPEATRERTDVILGRLRATTAALPGVASGGPPPLWGLATWPADGNDATALLKTARHRLSAT